MTEKSPAFQFYPKDFLSDERYICMTMEEKGVYMMLLCHCWLQGSIPADYDALRTLLGDHNLFSSTLKNVLNSFKEMNNNSSRLVSVFLQKELKKQKDWKKKCSEGGKKSQQNRVLKRVKGSSSLVQTPLEVKGNIAVCSLQSSSSSPTAIKDLKDLKHMCFFEEDWRSYPKRGNKQKAKASYLKTVTTPEKRQEFLSKTKEYVDSVDDPTYLKNGDTWFNQWVGYEVGPKVSRKTKGQKKFEDNMSGIKAMMDDIEREEQVNGQKGISQGSDIFDIKSITPGTGPD